MKHTDYNQVRQLAVNIMTDDKKMIQLIGDLDAELKKLEGSFIDDGIESVEAYVKGLEAKLLNAQEAFMIIANELKAYADMLERGKG